jgi:hypothetical protein
VGTSNPKRRLKWLLVPLWFRRLYESVLQSDTNVGTGTLGEALGKGAARLARKRRGPIGLCTAAVLVMSAMLAACSADLSLNNLTLAPSPPRKPDASAQASAQTSTQTWGRTSFERPITPADLAGAEGQCSPPASEQASAQPGAPADAQAAALGSIALRMTECDVVRRAGPVEKIELGATERGERSLVLTYLHGPSPGIYRFTGGRLTSIERAPDSPAPEKPHKPAHGAKKPAGT